MVLSVLISYLLSLAVPSCLLVSVTGIRWHHYLQNPDMVHPKLIPVPIGIDYHTLAIPDMKEHAWGTPTSAEVSSINGCHTRRCMLRWRP